MASSVSGSKSEPVLRLCVDTLFKESFNKNGEILSTTGQIHKLWETIKAKGFRSIYIAQFTSCILSGYTKPLLKAVKIGQTFDHAGNPLDSDTVKKELKIILKDLKNYKTAFRLTWPLLIQQNKSNFNFITQISDMDAGFITSQNRIDKAIKQINKIIKNKNLECAVELSEAATSTPSKPI